MARPETSALGVLISILGATLDEVAEPYLGVERPLQVSQNRTGLLPHHLWHHTAIAAQGRKVIIEGGSGVLGAK